MQVRVFKYYPILKLLSETKTKGNKQKTMKQELLIAIWNKHLNNYSECKKTRGLILKSMIKFLWQSQKYLIFSMFHFLKLYYMSALLPPLNYKSERYEYINANNWCQIIKMPTLVQAFSHRAFKTTVICFRDQNQNWSLIVKSHSSTIYTLKNSKSGKLKVPSPSLLH